MRGRARPILHRRRVTWGDTDPAAIVYTPRFLEYALEAIDSWLNRALGGTWYRLNTQMGLGAPVVAFRLDFVSPAKADEILTITTRLHEMGRSRLDFDLSGRIAGRLVYVARVTLVLIDPKGFKAKRFTKAMLERMGPWLPATARAGKRRTA